MGQKPHIKKRNEVMQSSPGEMKMYEDDIDDNDMDNDDVDDLPEFSIRELGQPGDRGDTRSISSIAIEERNIPSLAEIVAIANKDGRPISVEDCVLTNTQIRRADIDISVNDSVFTGKADFKNGVFGARFSFCDATFEREADFDQAVFRAQVSFEDCIFENKVNFAGATFEKGVSFTSCDFEEETTFDHATFGGEVDFSWSTFRKDVTCKDAVFSQAVDLSNVKFEGDLDSTGSNLADMKKEARTKQKDPQKMFQNKIKPKKTEFNPWRELDKVSKKTMSRRQILRGIFRFLPERKDE
jgi:uncharacterized protein YjbI with pentapeptide repeats